MLFYELIGPPQPFPKDCRVIVDAEFPGDIEGFKYELNVPGSESWAVVHLKNLWHAELLQGVPKPPHHLFPWRRGNLYPSHKGVNKSCEILEFLMIGLVDIITLPVLTWLVTLELVQGMEYLKRPLWAGLRTHLAG